MVRSIDIKELIDGRRREYQPDGLTIRENAEIEARDLLDKAAGRMSEGEVRQLAEILQRHWYNGKLRQDRFPRAFIGENLAKMTSDMALFNLGTGCLWKKGEALALDCLDDMLRDRSLLPGAGSSYPTVLLYVRDPRRFFLWTKTMDEGLEWIADYAGGKTSRGAEAYLKFCDTVASIVDQHCLRPQEVDGLLTDAARARRQTESG